MKYATLTQRSLFKVVFTHYLSRLGIWDSWLKCYLWFSSQAVQRLKIKFFWAKIFYISNQAFSLKNAVSQSIVIKYSFSLFLPHSETAKCSPLGHRHIEGDILSFQDNPHDRIHLIYAIDGTASELNWFAYHQYV